MSAQDGSRQQSTTDKYLTDEKPSIDNVEHSSDGPSEKGDKTEQKEESNKRSDGKYELEEDDCYDILPYSWPWLKRWSVLSVVFAVQVSMNFNTSVYPNAVMGVSETFKVSEQAARVGQMIFLVAYAFASELWAPWSEEFGRKPVLLLSLGLVNIWQILCALAPNYGSLIVGRFLGGACTAGGSVTLGVVADMYQPDDQQWAVSFIVLSSVLGTSIGPVIGGPIEKYLGWHWIFWIQLIFGGAVQIAYLFVPETRSTIILDREAKRRRKSGQEPNVYGPDELKEPRLSLKELSELWIRPFEMFVREPIVLSLSLLSGFSDALIFTFIEGFMPVYKQWEFGTLEQSWAFLPVVIGYFIAWVIYWPAFYRDRKVRKQKGSDALTPERRLWMLLFLAPLEPLGLFGFAWTSLGPPRVHWIAPMIFSCIIAIANYAIYMSTIDYMVAAYGVYSASATGGNALARDFLAGISAMYATPLYSNVGQKYKLEYASTILACLAIPVVIPVYVFYYKGEWFREKSKFASELAGRRKDHEGRRLSKASSRELHEAHV